MRGAPPAAASSLAAGARPFTSSARGRGASLAACFRGRPAVPSPSASPLVEPLADSGRRRLADGGRCLGPVALNLSKGGAGADVLNASKGLAAAGTAALADDPSAWGDGPLVDGGLLPHSRSACG